jgi:hypothetical protein
MPTREAVGNDHVHGTKSELAHHLSITPALSHLTPRSVHGSLSPVKLDAQRFLLQRVLLTATSMVLELHVWGPAFGLPSIDPECIAVIAYFNWKIPQPCWQLVADYDTSIGPQRRCTRPLPQRHHPCL